MNMLLLSTGNATVVVCPIRCQRTIIHHKIYERRNASQDVLPTVAHTRSADTETR